MYKVVNKCINQDTKETMYPGDKVKNLSHFELGRHLAEGNIVPINGRSVERAVSDPPEKRKRGRPKNEPNGR